HFTLFSCTSTSPSITCRRPEHPGGTVCCQTTQRTRSCPKIHCLPAGLCIASATRCHKNHWSRGYADERTAIRRKGGLTGGRGMGTRKVSRRRFVASTAALSTAMVAAPFVRGAYAAGKLSLGLWDHWVPEANKPTEKLIREWAEKEKVDVQID